jgi:hypothetical protein
MTPHGLSPGPYSAVEVDAKGITDVLDGRPLFSIRWSEIEAVSVAVDPYVSGPRPCAASWLIEGAGRRVMLPLRGRFGVAELALRLVTLAGFDCGALRDALAAEAACRGGRFVCWRRDGA